MPDFAKNGYQGLWQPGKRIDGQEGITLVVKRRFAVDQFAGACVPVADAEQPPVTISAEFYDEDDPANSDVRVPAESAAHKERVDVMLRGVAYAPGGRPTPSFEVRCRIEGVLDRRLRISGDRIASYVPPEKILTDKDFAKGAEQEYSAPVFSEARPIVKLPLRYRYSYGGNGVIILEPEEAEEAAEHQEEAAKKEEKRKKKKAKEAELIAAAEAEEAAKKAPPPADGISDDIAREKAKAVFTAGTPEALDEAELKRLSQEVPEHEMRVVSRFAFDDAREAAAHERAIKANLEESAADEDEDQEASASEDDADDDPLAGVFTESTGFLDVSDLPADEDAASDLKRSIAEREQLARRNVVNEAGVKSDRAREFGDIELADDDWRDELGRPIERPKEEAEVDDRPAVRYPANPIGRGFCVSQKEGAIDGLLLPNIEDPEALLQPADLVVDLEGFDLNALQAPAGWGPYPMAWYPRARSAGAYSWDLEGAEAAIAAAIAEYDPDDPDDEETLEQLNQLEVPIMRPAFFQEAHPTMQLERLDGDEQVLLENLNPDGRLYFALPAQHPRATMDIGLGPQLVPMRIDSLLLDIDDPENPAVELIWRGWVRLAKMEDIEKFTKLEFAVDAVDQDDWGELNRQWRKQEKAAAKDGGVTLDVGASDDGDDSAEDAFAAYREDIGAERGSDDEVGVAKDEGVTVWDQDGERRLSDDDWADELRGDKQSVEDRAAELTAEGKAARDKELRKKARELIDAEEGIEPADGEG